MVGFTGGVVAQGIVHIPVFVVAPGVGCVHVVGGFAVGVLFVVEFVFGVVCVVLWVVVLLGVVVQGVVPGFVLVCVH